MHSGLVRYFEQLRSILSQWNEYRKQELANETFYSTTLPLWEETGEMLTVYIFYTFNDLNQALVNAIG